MTNNEANGEAVQFATEEAAFAYFCDETTEGDYAPFYDDILEVWLLLNTETDRFLEVTR